MAKNRGIHGSSIEVKSYWDNKYSENQTGWDIGVVSIPVKEYVNQLSDKIVKVLIPGAGNAHEAEYLFVNGFNNVFVLDISRLALDNFRKRFPDFPVNQLLCEDFFGHNKTYDLIIEQTFFCAINPLDRKKYAQKVHSLLKVNGKLVGLLFNHEFEEEGPPFGGSIDEYEKIFSPYFNFKTFELSYNSIKPREGREHFIIFVKK